MSSIGGGGCRVSASHRRMPGRPAFVRQGGEPSHQLLRDDPHWGLRRRTSLARRVHGGRGPPPLDRGSFNNTSDTGRTQALVLTGVALLGEAYPAITTLEDIQAIYSSSSIDDVVMAVSDVRATITASGETPVPKTTTPRLHRRHSLCLLRLAERRADVVVNSSDPAQPTAARCR